MKPLRVRLRPNQCIFCRYHASATPTMSRPSSQQPPRLDLGRNIPTRPFSSSPARPSHIGGAPLSIPSSVTFNVLSPIARPDQKVDARRQDLAPSVEIKGPLGQLCMPIPKYISINYDQEARKAIVSIQDRTDKQQRAMWGTTRAYLANYILGVSEGHTTLLRLVGVGYRATIEPSATTVSPTYPGQKFVNLKLGYSHPIEMGIPEGVTASTPQPTRILLEGAEKEVVNQFAARIRKWRVPEPYKGKGIFVNDETIKLKAKKIK